MSNYAVIARHNDKFKVYFQIQGLRSLRLYLGKTKKNYCRYNSWLFGEGGRGDLATVFIIRWDVKL